MNDYLKFLKSRSRFMAWLLVFLFLLLSIPILLKLHYSFSAKVVGFFVIVFLSVALWRWRMQTVLKIQKASRIKLNLNDRFWLDKHIHFYHNLTRQEKIIFEDRIGLFLAEIKITEVGNEIPEKSTCLYVASSAIIAYWGLPYWNYGKLTEVLVYPENFTLDNKIDSRGIVEGKVHHGGLMDSTMILSLRALKSGFREEQNKHNVGIHEFSHLLDKEDGVFDGVPFFINQEERISWFLLLKDEIKKIKEHHSDINLYAATNESEFFAVIMEYFKGNPELFHKKHPELFHFLNLKYIEITESKGEFN